MADETVDTLGGRVDEFVMMVGTAGCFSGNADRLQGARCPACGVWPANRRTSRALSGLAPTGGHRIEGTGPGFVPGNYRADLADAVRGR